MFLEKLDHDLLSVITYVSSCPPSAIFAGARNQGIDWLNWLRCMSESTFIIRSGLSSIVTKRIYSY